jgi:hypothetical protein
VMKRKFFFWPKTAREAPAVQALLNQENNKWIQMSSRRSWKKNTFKLSVQVKKIEKGGSLILLHSMGLEIGLLEKPNFPAQKRRGASVQDEVISLFPNQLGSNDECFHEEAVIVMLFCVFHHRMEV